jgi:hypothetical protein
MNRSNEERRVRRCHYPAPDVLEDRMVLSAGQGSTFAIMPGKVATAGVVSALSFKIDPSLFSTPDKHGRIVVGIDVAPVVPASATTTTSNLKPEIISVTDAAGRVTRVQHTRYDRKVAKANKLAGVPTSAVLVHLNVPAAGQPAADYTVQVKGLNGTTGQYLVGFYLPGDVAGTGTVTKDDIQTIQKDRSVTAVNSNYNFDADVNRDGVINSQDMKIARENLGVATKVSPVISVNLDPASNPAANRISPFSTVHFAGKATPGAQVTFVDSSGGATVSAKADSTGAYSVMVPLVVGSNTFTVTTLDQFGQSIIGAISPVVYSPPKS